MAPAIFTWMHPAIIVPVSTVSQDADFITVWTFDPFPAHPKTLRLRHGRSRQRWGGAQAIKDFHGD